MANDIRVRIIGDDSSLHKALGHATSGTSKFSRALGVGLKGAAVVAGTALAGLGIAAKIGFDEFKEAQKVAAQTNAVIKSTGGVANVTARQVDTLADSLMRKSGVDDEVIKSGENVLLTFRYIRNEAGKGNDIFNQATKATLDLSVALGKDMKSASILVGKALNDPLKGMTALTRAGVQFTDAQKEQIKRMVESGDVMGAQKLILKELNTEFGGSAKALGDTLPGQMNKFKESFRNAMGAAVEALAPFLGQLADWATKHMPQIQQAMTTAFTVIARVIETVAGFISTHWDTITAIFEGFKTTVATVAAFVEKNWPRVSAAVTTAIDTIRGVLDQAISYYQSNVAPAIENVVTAITAFWDRFGADIMRIVGTAFNIVQANIKMVLGIITGIIKFFLAVLRGDWQGAWNALKQIVSSVLNGIVGLIKGIIGLAAAQARALGTAIKDGVVAGLSKLKGAVTDALGAIKDAIFGLIGSVYGWAKSIGKAMIDGIVAGLSGLIGAIKDKITSGISQAAGAVTGGRVGGRAISTDVGAFDLGTKGGAPIVAGGGGGLTLILPTYLDGQLIYQNQKNIAAADLRRNLGF